MTTIPTTADEPVVLPALDLRRLSVADIPMVFKIMDAKGGRERTDMMLQILAKAVEGGLEAIPLPYFSKYMARLDRELSEAFGIKVDDATPAADVPTTETDSPKD